MKCRYAGIGSRETPPEALARMTELSKEMANLDWILHSGGAYGADTAFEDGCRSVGGEMQIFLPWHGFNGNPSKLSYAPQEAFDIAERIHPAWKQCSEGAKKLHARNIQQILGYHLDTPIQLLICWTKDGKTIGGTATAVNLAYERGIKVFNLGKDNVLLTNDAILCWAYNYKSPERLM